MWRWPLTADARDDQLFLVASHGYRAIAHDRRGGGRSGQPWNGNDLDTYRRCRRTPYGRKPQAQTWRRG
jgi:pimeloyl-ACP methyl ester carboxylesterase